MHGVDPQLVTHKLNLIEGGPFKMASELPTKARGVDQVGYSKAIGC